MTRTRRHRHLPALLITGLLLAPTTGALTVVAPPALAADQACTQAVGGMRAFADGHQDMLLRSDGVVLDYEHRETFSSGEFLFEVPDSARSATGWVLPQTQEAGLPWPGFSTTGLSYGADISLASFSGPGQMTAYQGDLFDTTTRLDSSDTSVTWDLPANTHAHTAFSFTEPGAYEITFRFTTSANGTHDISTIFLVGSAAIAESATGTVTVSCDSSTGSGTPKGPVEQLTADLTGVTKEVSKLDRAMGGFLDSVKKEITPSTTQSTATAPTPASAAPSRPAPTAPQPRPQAAAHPAAPAAPAPRPAPSAPGQTSTPATAPPAAASPAPATPDITQVNTTAPFVGVLSGTAWGLGVTALLGGIALFASAFRMRSRLPREDQHD